MRIFHSQAFRPLIHLLYKFFFIAADVLGHCHAGIIGAGNGDAFDHRIYRLRLTRFQEHLGASHGGGIFGCGDFIFQADLSGIQSVKDQKQRHDLGHAGRRSLLICILFIYDLTGGRFHQDCGWSADLGASLIPCAAGGLPPGRVFGIGGLLPFGGFLRIGVLLRFIVIFCFPLCIRIQDWFLDRHCKYGLYTEQGA